MPDIRKLRTCEKCKADVPANLVKLYPRDANRNWMVCENCLAKMKDVAKAAVASQPKPVKKELIRNTYTRTVTPVPKELSEQKGLFCFRCNYRFKIDDTKAGVLHRVMCPYCGKNDQLKKK